MTPDIRLPKIIVLDDDPTGSQTVHSCLLLMQWDVDTLRLGLSDPSPIMFILTNTRSLHPTEAERVTREICRQLKQAIALEQLQDVLIVSRSDSTLRGHYPLETSAIAEELGPFDAHFLVPAFLEGGRVTRHSRHYVVSDGVAIPAHDTEFARDAVFAFHHSYLPDYVEEKTHGQIPADAVECLQLEEVRAGCLDRLLTLQHNQCVAVDGETQADLNQFATDVLTAAARGKRFLFRSAASLLTALAQLPPQSVEPNAMGQFNRAQRPGVVLVGSYVAKTTLQLQELLQVPNVVGVEVDVRRLLSGEEVVRQAVLSETLHRIHMAHHEGQGVVIYTTREEIPFPDLDQRIRFSQGVAALLIDVVKGLPATIGFLISKGGITSNNTLSHGLALRSVRLLGQIIPGCCIVRTETTHPQFPDLPVVLFPGNVGEADGLAIAYKRLAW